MSICIFHVCEEPATRDKWCDRHWGLYPHKCEFPTCDARSNYDDEPYCFVHSPDEGSSVRGYSAYQKQLDKRND